MNPLNLMTPDEQAEIRHNLFASEEFFAGFATAAARAGLAPGRDTRIIENVIHPKITLELSLLRELVIRAREAMPILADDSFIKGAATNHSENKFGTNANAKFNALRAALEAVEKLLDIPTPRK